MTERRRRNIVVICSGEHNARCLGSTGHPHVQTPNLDGLAARGTRFDNAWTPSPICVPARASMAAATAARVSTLVLFHHHQLYDDVTLDGLEDDARAAAPAGLTVLPARDGFVVAASG